METEYESCACTPVGKVKRVSQPYGPAGPLTAVRDGQGNPLASAWTTYVYDGLGRTVPVTPPATASGPKYIEVFR